MSFDVKGRLKAEARYDGKNLVIAITNKRYVKINRDGTVINKLPLDGFYEVEGLWQEFLKFADDLVVWGKHKDIYIDTEGSVVEAILDYENFEVHIKNDICALSMRDIDFYASEEGLYIVFNKKPIGFFGKMPKAKGVFRKRYFDWLIKQIKSPQVATQGKWFYVNEIEITFDNCKCDIGESGVVIPINFDVEKFYKWILWVAQNEVPDRGGWNEKKQRNFVKYGKLFLYYTKDFKFAGAYYQCGCVEIDLVVLPHIEFFRFDAKKSDYVLHFDGKDDVHRDFCKRLENSEAVAYLKAYLL